MTDWQASLSIITTLHTVPAAEHGFFTLVLPLGISLHAEGDEANSKFLPLLHHLVLLLDGSAQLPVPLLIVCVGIKLNECTVGPQNNGHSGPSLLSFVERLSSFGG